MDLTDYTTWQTSSLNTPEGEIRYWVLFDPDSYYEQYADNNNLTRIHLAVAWGDATKFKRYALGFTKHTPGLSYLTRYNPLRNPYYVEGEDQYLSELRKVKVLAGQYAPGVYPDRTLYHHADPLLDNWPNFYVIPESQGMPARIVYEAVFTTLPYDVQDMDTFRTAGAKEMTRNVVRMKAVNARERKVPSFGFEVVIGSDTIPVPEVGFIPFYDYELYHTWKRVPRDRQPDTAIANCLLKANDAPFDYNPLSTAEPKACDKYREGDLVFVGLAQKVEPYKGPNGEWLVDLPYVFRHQPADGTGDGMLKIPYYSATLGSTWVQPFVRGSSASKKYLYSKANFDTLFEPEP